jgi:hypothetical protein
MIKPHGFTIEPVRGSHEDQDTRANLKDAG